MPDNGPLQTFESVYPQTLDSVYLQTLQCVWQETRRPDRRAFFPFGLERRFQEVAIPDCGSLFTFVIESVDVHFMWKCNKSVYHSTA